MINKNKELEYKLNEQKKKNQEIMQTNIKLEELIKTIKNENIKKIKNKEELINSKNKAIEKLNEQLKKFQKITNENFQSKEILKLVNKLNEKEEEIKKLKLIFPFEIKQGEKIMTVNFISVDQKILCSFICKNTDIFSRLENLLYDKYPEYRESENYFLIKGYKINRFKSLDNNNIKDNDIITLNQY